MGPHRHTAQHTASALLAVWGVIGPSVPRLSSHRVAIVLPQPIDMNQRSLARAVFVVF